MAVRIRTRMALVLALVPLVAGCGGATPATSPPATGSSATPTESAAVTPSPAGATPLATPGPASPTPSVTTSPASPTPFSAPTAFTSPIYGYTVTLPAGWTVVPATDAWDGSSAIGDADPTVDQLTGPRVTGRCTAVYLCGPDAWGFAAPTSQRLAAYVKARDAAAAHDHACAATPEREQSVTVAQTPAVLETTHCPPGTGIFVICALTIRHGIAYSFYLQDPSHDRGAEPADRADFLALLKTVRLP